LAVKVKSLCPPHTQTHIPASILQPWQSKSERPSDIFLRVTRWHHPGSTQVFDDTVLSIHYSALAGLGFYPQAPVSTAGVRDAAQMTWKVSYWSHHSIGTARTSAQTCIKAYNTNWKKKTFMKM